jgi:hypothetical protein
VSDPHEFLFALQLSDEPHFDAMIAELAGAVLVHVGYQAAAVDELRALLRSALASGLTNGELRCSVQFRAEGGELQIVVASPGGAEWRTSRALP